jgi:hypothetical protein
LNIHIRPRNVDLAEPGCHCFETGQALPAVDRDIAAEPVRPGAMQRASWLAVGELLSATARQNRESDRADPATTPSTSRFTALINALL